MANIASKNLFDLLGNDPELDPDREPEPPTKAIDKPVQRAGKRNAGAEGPSEGTGRPRGGGRGGRHQNFSGSEGAFRDPNAGSYNNRSRGPDDGVRQDRHPDRLRDSNDPGYGRRGGRGRGGSGGRFGRGGNVRDDRHSKTGIGEHDKQAAHGWGGQTGTEEWAEEKAGEAIAKDEGKAGFDANVPPPVNADGEVWKPDTEGAGNDWAPDTEGAGENKEPEPEEDKTKSYAAYLAEQAEKKLHLGSLQARKPNEGGDKKFPEGKAFSRDDEENYMAGSSSKAGRLREKKEKNRLQLDDERLLKAPELGGGRGGRGRGRGDRGDGSFRGEGGRGRGGRGRGDRGDRGFSGERGRGGGRGGRGGGPSANLNPNDQSAFPSLGS